jgi:hypothetical protein
MIWAFNNADYYVGYHSSSNRGRITVQWSDGANPTTPEPSATSSTMSTGALAAIIALAVLLVLVLVLLILALIVLARRGKAADNKATRAGP